MKLLLLILVLQNVNECRQMSVYFKDKMDYMAWRSEIAWITRKENSLQSLLVYHDIRSDIKNLVDLKFPELHFNVKDIYAFCKNEREKKYDFQWFCKLYYVFEYNEQTKFVFSVNNLDLWFLNSQNITIHSDQVVNNARNILYNTG